jgi:hypothetical protein
MDLVTVVPFSKTLKYIPYMAKSFRLSANMVVKIKV